MSVTSWDTPICRLLGIDIPLVQAPIGSASTAGLAVAVSEHGALGTIARTWRSEHDVRRLTREIAVGVDVEPSHPGVPPLWPTKRTRFNLWSAKP
jgi:NAD(P)H-dependent flavin oxidoreductase YrpB (nitropropane dioxygenase family)